MIDFLNVSDNEDDGRDARYEATVVACDSTSARACKRARREQFKQKEEATRVLAASAEHNLGHVCVDPEAPFRAAIEGVVAVTGTPPPPLSTTSDPRSVLSWVVKTITTYGKRERELAEHSARPAGSCALHPDLVQPAMKALETLNSLLSNDRQ